MDSSLDNKAQFNEVERIEDSTPNSALAKSENAAPEYVAALTAEDRATVEQALLKKIDIRMMPMLILIYVMNYLDRNNISAAELAGMKEDLNLVGNQFQTAVSILFVGYLLMQVPSNLLLNKLGKPSVYLPTCMAAWGVVSASTAACQSFGSLLAIRFILGFVEAAYFPGCLYLLSAWYTRKELVKRTALLYSGSLLSGAFSGLISSGIVNGLDGARNMRAWRWLFIIEGSITVFVAIFAIFVLPDMPRTTKWLNEDEKELAVWRLQEDIGQDDWVNSGQQTFLHGAKLAAKDPKAWLLLGIVFGGAATGTVTTLFPVFMKSLGKGDVQTLLLTTPPYLIAVIVVLINAWHADRSGERYLHVALPPMVAIAAFILCVASTAFAPRYVAMCLMIGSNYASYVVALGWISNIIPRPASKRAAALAGINCLSNVAQIYTPFLYPSGDAPRYIKAMVVDIAMCMLTIFFSTLLRFHLKGLNKRLDAGEIIEGVNSRPSARGPDQEAEGEEIAVDRGFRFLL